MNLPYVIHMVRREIRFMNASEALEFYNTVALLALARYNQCALDHSAQLAWQVKACFIGERTLLECI